MDIDAYVSEISGNRAGHLAEEIQIRASYEEANILGEINFRAPIADAQKYYVGQRLRITVEVP